MNEYKDKALEKLDGMCRSTDGQEQARLLSEALIYSLLALAFEVSQVHEAITNYDLGH